MNPVTPKRCPMCSGPAVLELLSSTDEVAANITRAFRVSCTKCRLTIERKSPVTALIAWNRRVSPAEEPKA